MRAISMVVVLIAILALVLAGCANEVNLSYSAAPENVVVEVSSSGGLPTPWVDNVASFKLYGDGRVVKVSDESRHGMLVEGKLDEVAMKVLLLKMQEAGFFGLKNAYSAKGVMDGVTARVAVTLVEQKKTVSNYMADVPGFTRTLDVIRGYPVNGVYDFVPDKGYLVVREGHGAACEAADSSTWPHGAPPVGGSARAGGVRPQADRAGRPGVPDPEEVGVRPAVHGGGRPGGRDLVQGVPSLHTGHFLGTSG